MKVLMVTTGMNIGGAETHIAELCRAFAEKGISVTVASAGGVYVRELEKRGIPHITLPLNRKTPASLLKAKKGLENLIRHEKFDVVHAHARIPAFLCGKLQARMGFRFVTTDHLDFRVTPLLKRLTDWGEFTFAVSEDLKEYLIGNFGLASDRIAMTVNGIDTDRFSPKTSGASLRESFRVGDRAVILHVSRLEKHLALCVRALMGAVKQLNGSVSLVVAGDGAYAQTLREEADALNRELGYRAAVFVGAVTDVENYIAAADIAVSPSRAAMEAMACGKPTVICGSQGYGGIFGENVAEDAVKSNFCFRGASLPTPEILARDIVSILGMSEEERTRLVDFGRRFICENYSVRVMAQTQLDGYRRLLAQRESLAYDILICGYYGYGNMGDETMLSVVTKELLAKNPHLRLCVLSADAHKTSVSLGIDAIPRFDPKRVAEAMSRSRMLLFGGGNLLQDKTSTHSLLYYTHILRAAKKRGLKIYVYANGIGPILRKGNRARTAEALRLADAVSLRDKDSLAFVKDLPCKKPARLTFDPAILAERADFPIPKGNYFVAVPKRTVPSDKLARLISLLAQKTKMTPVLVSIYDEQDCRHVERIAAQIGASVCRPKSAGECISLFSSAKLVVSSRLHALVYATAAACPMMAYSDDRKLFSYLESIGLGADSPHCCGISADEDVGLALKTALSILEQSEYFIRELTERLARRKALAKQGILDILEALETAETDFFG